MEDFNDIIEAFALTDFFSIDLTPQLIFYDGENPKEVISGLNQEDLKDMRSISSIATKDDFRFIFQREAIKSNISDEFLPGLKSLLKERIIDLIEKEKGKGQKFRNDKMILLASTFIEWLSDAEQKDDETLNIAENYNQTKKVGFLIRGGIIDFLKEKHGMNNNQISAFLEFITKEPMKKASVNPHLSKENSKYPLQNKFDKSDADLLLQKFRMKPLSD